MEINKQEFLARLRRGLSGMAQDDIEERIIFYSEMIDDRMEEGLSEAEAVDAIGTVDDVVSQILTDKPLVKQVKEQNKQRSSMRPWEVVLLILGFPVWFPILAAVFAIVLAAYIVVWALVVSLWAVEAALLGAALGGVISAAAFAIYGGGLRGVVMLSAGLFCAGLSIFIFFACKAVTKGGFLLTKRAVLWLKSLFVGREAA